MLTVAALPSKTCAPKVTSAEELCRVMRSTSPGAAAAWTRGLDRVLRHDADQGLLEVQAAVPWHTLKGIEGAEYFPATIGETVAKNLPGPDGRPVVAHLNALTLATPDGQLRRASRERAPELFGLAVGGFGAFGPFYSLTLDLGSLARAARAAAAPMALPLPRAAAGVCQHVVELLLPPERAEAVALQACDAVAERRLHLTRIVKYRTLAECLTVLRWAGREYVVLRIEVGSRATLGASVAAAELQSRLIDASIAAGGSFMPAHLPSATRAQAEACYPMLGAFLAEKRRLDPGERVDPPWLRDTSRNWRAERCRVRFS